MKKIFVLTLTITFAITAFGQKDTSYWKTTGIFGVKLSQVAYKNWSAGGENSLAAIGSFQYQATYLKDRVSWDNLLLADLGFLKQGTDSLRKTDDRFEFNSKFGYGFNKSNHWFYSALINFKSQFMDGYDFTNDTPAYISNFMAPAYLKLALGIDYQQESKFTLFMSPATARWTFVNDQTLADAGSYGVEAAVLDTAGTIITPGKNVRFELGAFLRAAYSQDLMENINLLTKLELYSNYLDRPQNIDLDWQVVFNFKVNKYFTASISGHIIYDHDIKFGIDSNNDGAADYQAPRTQFKEVLGIGFNYKF
ncbi:MAG: DUF3078 domain-containing protein [Bacteroidales bacterium]|nr:DUF3078 domain-containing protein [Bacteroidales bacterium]